MLNEVIVSTGIYYSDEKNIAQCSMTFHMVVRGSTDEAD